MATVVNEMVLEPKAEPPAPAAAKSGGEKSPASDAETERKIQQMLKKKHERALRLCAY